MSLFSARSYASLLALGAIVGVVGTAIISHAAPIKKSLGIGSGSSLALASENTRCTENESEEVYFVSCGGLF